MPRISPFLWFDGQAQGTVMTVEFEIERVCNG